MHLKLYACGFNGFRQFGATEDVCSHFWMEVPSAVSEHTQVTLCWAALFLLDAGCVRKNGEVLRLNEEAKSKVLSVAACEDRLATVLSDGSVHLQQSDVTGDVTWRQLVLQSAGDDVTSSASQLSIGSRTLAACDASGHLLTLDGVPTPPGEHVTQVTCGREHVTLLTRSGHVYTYGGGSRGQLGTGDLGSADTPRLLEALGGVTVLQISAGGWHSAAVSASGDVYTWGWNVSNQLGLGGDVTVAAEPSLVDQLPTESHVTQVACGSRHTVVLLDDGTVWGWGWNSYGQLTQTPCDVIKVTKLAAPPGRVVRLAAGGWNTAAICRTDD